MRTFAQRGLARDMPLGNGMNPTSSSIHTLLLSLGLLSGGVAGCSSNGTPGPSDAAMDVGPVVGCGNAPPCTPGCPAPLDTICDAGTEGGKLQDALIDGPVIGCGNAIACTPGCPETMSPACDGGILDAGEAGPEAGQALPE